MQREDLYMLVLADRALYVWLQLLKLRSCWRPITLSPVIHDILVKMLFAQALNFRRVRSRLCQLVLVICGYVSLVGRKDDQLSRSLLQTICY